VFLEIIHHCMSLPHTSLPVVACVVKQNWYFVFFFFAKLLGFIPEKALWNTTSWYLGQTSYNLRYFFGFFLDFFSLKSISYKMVYYPHHFVISKGWGLCCCGTWGMCTSGYM